MHDNQQIPSVPLEDTVFKQKTETNTASKPSSHVPTLLIIFGIFGLLSALLTSFSILRTAQQIGELYSNLNIPREQYNPYLLYVGMLIFYLLPLSQMIYGVKLRKIQNTNSISQKQRLIGILMLTIPILISILTIPVYIISAINPVYNLVEQIDQKEISAVSTVTPSPLQPNTQTKEISLVSSVTPSPQSNTQITAWKTFDNKTYEFTIQYPNEWYAENTNTGDYAIDFFDTDPASLTMEDNILRHIKFRFRKDSSQLILKEFEVFRNADPNTDVPEGHHGDNVTTYKVKNLFIDGFPAVEIIYDATRPAQRELSYAHKYYIRKDDVILIYRNHQSTKKETENLDPLFQKFINSIDFY